MLCADIGIFTVLRCYEATLAAAMFMVIVKLMGLLYHVTLLLLLLLHPDVNADRYLYYTYTHCGA